MRAILLTCLLVLVTVSVARGQTSPPPAPSLTVTPATGSVNTAHDVRIDNMPSGAPLLILFAPDGKQTLLHPYAADGAYLVELDPPSGGWTPGLYRVVLGLDGGNAVSRTFSAGMDPALYAAPPSPSPTAVFNLIGTNLAPNTTVSVHLFLTGGIQGERVIPATTDGTGAFSIYVWPQALGFPFFPAGTYQASLPDYNLETTFAVREHPASATLTTVDAVTSGQPLDLSFTLYQPNRYLWGVYAPGNGAAMGEFLAGPTSPSETAAATLGLGSLAAGQYYVATPYDWGETTFTVLAPPTATPTDTPTATPTSTPTPTATPKSKPTSRPKPTATPKPRVLCKSRVKKGHKKKRCKR